MKNNKKLLKIGSYSIGVSAIVLAVIIVLNLLVGQMPTKWTKIDTTANKLLTLGDETKKLLSTVDEDVNIYFISQSGAQDDSISELANRYAQENSKIKLTTVDPLKQPTFTSKYTEGKDSTTVVDNTVIVESGKRFMLISGDEFYMYEPTGFSGTMLTKSEFTYYQQMYSQQGYSFTGTPYFFGEKKISGAIDYVIADTLPVLYALSGHGETALSDLYKGYTADENVEIKDLTLASGDTVKVPDDAAAVLINVPTGDITTVEYDALVAYLQNGGNVILLSALDSFTKANMPNMTALTEFMGLSAIEDLVVEGDTNHYGGYPQYLLPTVLQNGPAKLLESTNLMIMSVLSHGISETGAENREVTPLLQTSSSAFLLSKEGEETATYNVAYQSKITDENGSTKGTLVWFASPYILDDNFSQKTGYSNNLLYAAALQQMCEKTASISVIAKEITSATITVTEAQSIQWHIVYICILPAIALFSGFVIWFIRRRR